MVKQNEMIIAALKELAKNLQSINTLLLSEEDAPSVKDVASLRDAPSVKDVASLRDEVKALMQGALKAKTHKREDLKGMVSNTGKQSLLDLTEAELLNIKEVLNG